MSFQLFALGAFLIIMVGLVVITAGWYIVHRQTAKAIAQFTKDQNAIGKLLIKVYEDFNKAAVLFRTTPPAPPDTTPIQVQGNGHTKAEVLKEVGLMLRSEVNTGSIFIRFPEILNSLINGTMPADGSAPAPETTTGPGAADPPADQDPGTKKEDQVTEPAKDKAEDPPRGAGGKFIRKVKADKGGKD